VIELEIRDASSKIWPVFAPHHYMSAKYQGHGCYVALLDDVLVGFTSYGVMPGFPPPQYAAREHRTVILPDYQGIGIGIRLSNWLAQMLQSSGYRVYSKTSHPRMGEYRSHSELWKPTSQNMKTARKQAHGEKTFGTVWPVKERPAYSHEYIGTDPELYSWVMSLRRPGK
jgi:GNAT superfamily N-acetyltransferase